MKILSIDFGTKTIGLAIGEIEMRIPKKIPSILMDPDGKHIEKIIKIIEEEGIYLILLGIPTVKEPSKSWIYKKIFSFGIELKRNTNKNLILFNESETSKKARERFKKRGYDIHSASSLILLERFFNLK